MSDRFRDHLEAELAQLRADGLYKEERVITSPQSARIEVQGSPSVLNFCANNYLGLADNQELERAAKQALERYGYGMASVRFICGTGKRSIKRSRAASPASSAWRTRSSTPPASMPTPASSRPYSASPRTRSSRTPSTTPR